MLPSGRMHTDCGFLWGMLALMFTAGEESSAENGFRARFHAGKLSLIQAIG